MNDIIRVENVTKRFPGVVALKNVTFSIKQGSVHALLGENGAGKSTLIKILTGTYTDYEGKIFYKGNEVKFSSEKDAIDSGISVVPQELHPIDQLTIAENLFIGREPMTKLPGFIDKKKRALLTERLLTEFAMNYSADTKMGALSVAQKQMIEIIKAISRDSRVIIMDEPTSALTKIETKYLFEQIQKLKEKGVSILFISHKLDEVYAVCDTVTVLRDGQYIGTKLLHEVDEAGLIRMMVGRDVSDIYPLIDRPQKEEVLSVKNLTSKGVFENISFTLHKGEILGFAGMMGAGRSEIMRSIFGMDHYDSGSIVINGRELHAKSAADAIRAGIAMVTEDRARYGFVGKQSIEENIELPNTDIFTKNSWVNFKKLRKSAENICSQIRVKALDVQTKVGTLSGGNQQKVVLSKWLVRGVQVLIMDEPTRGIDVGAKQEIYRLIKQLASEGMAILMVSSELPEVISMSHRIEIIADGRIVGEVQGKKTTQNEIMSIIAGRKTNE